VLVDLGLAALAGAWMGLIYALRSRWQQRQRLMEACFVVLLGLMAALVLHNSLFGFFTWTGYLWAALVLAVRWRMPAFAAVAVITATAQHGGLPTGSASSWIGWIAFIAINLIAAEAVSAFARARQVEHERRKQTIDELTVANAKLEESLAENAGLRAQLVAQAREAGVLDERQRMAGEIHDTLAQGLVGIITQLEAVSRDALPAESERHMTAAVELARESLTEARRSVQALRPVPLEQAGLPEALRDVAAKWSERTHVQATVTTTGAVSHLRDEVELALLRTAQEALANVTKHAEAGRVVLTLSYMDDVVTLDVCDDGVGFAPASSPSLRNGGFGLTAMRQRIEGLEGTLEIESEPGAGTTIAASIPAGSHQ
jgi:signal transduction histidine kinase